jgi:hypothetical protein
LTLVMSTSAMAATHPFYASMLQRGLAKAQQGKYADAIRDLRVAAFGTLDEPGAYQLAQIHIAIANEKLGNSDEARLAATKFLQSERLRPTYASLDLDATTRDAFEKLVASAVEPQYLAQLPSFRRSSPKSVTAVATTAKELPLPSTTTPPPAVSVQKPAIQPPAVPKAPVTIQQSTVQQSTVQKPAVPATSVQKPPVVASPAPAVATAGLREAQQLLHEGKLLAARQAYEKLGQSRNLSRNDLLEIGRGLNRTGAYQQSAFIYQRTLPLRKGEELHMFYEAVNRYELGERSVARTLLARALPGLAVTREIESYRAKINGNS